MFIHGENDNDVPIAEAEQSFIALKDVGVDTVMVRYPREGHGIRETAHVVDIIDRSLAWYDRTSPRWTRHNAERRASTSGPPDRARHDSQHRAGPPGAQENGDDSLADAHHYRNRES